MSLNLTVISSMTGPVDGCVLEGLTNKKERDKIGKEGEKLWR